MNEASFQQRMGRQVSDILIGGIMGLILLNGLMYFQQSSMIFIPYRELVANPRDWGLAYEDVRLDTQDGEQLHGWYIPAPGARKTLLFFHGNAGNISHREQSIAIFHRLGLNVFIIDYRGYGRSSGHPTEAGLFMDAQAAWDYLRQDKQLAASDIIIFGRSLGGAVAANLAAKTSPAALILESTLSSARDFAHHVFPILSRLVVLRFNFNTEQRVTEASCPLLVLHSPEDEIMPYALGQQVYQAANEPKRFVTLRGDHNNGFILSQPDYEQSLRHFIGEL